MRTEGTNLLLLTISAFWSSGHLDELQKAEKFPIGWSLYTGFTVMQHPPAFVGYRLIDELCYARDSSWPYNPEGVVTLLG